MSVKLEVGKWYKSKSYTVLNGELVQKLPHDKEWGDECFYVPSLGVMQSLTNGDFTGPYTIEPGDVVKPKPAGDKCWEERGGHPCMNEVQAYGEFIADGSAAQGFGPADRSWGVQISCLILLKKGAKAPAQDFQVGDEVMPDGWGCPLLVSGVGDMYINLMNSSGCHIGLWKREHLKLIRRAGEKAETNKAAGVGPTEPTSESPNKGNVSSSPAAPLNPRVLPSHSGSELLWPDVKPGALLDTLPMDMSTKEDDKAVEYSGVLSSLTGTILDSLDSLNKNIGNIHNADRERIRKIIPEIERKLTQLKGRL